MEEKRIRILIYLVLFTISVTCKKAYAPPAVQASNNYLVIDGIINTGFNSVTSIVLSRSKNLADTVLFIPELNAQVAIESNTGNQYPLIDSTHNGHYKSAQLSLSATNQYRINIKTADSHQYLSGFVSPKISPPIDSVTWQQNNDISIYVNTHDPQNKTQYYRWDFTETWEHDAPMQTSWVLINGLITPLDSANDVRQITRCWTNAPSTNILIGSSVGLSQDIISRQPLTTIIQNDERLTIRYSILVNQYAITDSAYYYWSLVQKNSQQLGTLFDVQPSQLFSNIRCTTNPSEPVIGYMSASSIQGKRIFISNSQVSNWIRQEPYNECLSKVIPTDPLNFQSYNYPDLDYLPWYFTGSTTIALVITKKYCIDCSTQGGNNLKPLYW